MSAQKVIGDICFPVSNMRIVIDGRATGINRNFSRVDRFKYFLLLCECIVKSKHIVKISRPGVYQVKGP